MKFFIYILILATIIGCEVFTIGRKSKPVVPVNQYSAVGSAYMFKAGLDSNNVFAITQLIKGDGGSPIPAEMKYSKFEDLERISRIIGNKPVTLVNTDSLSDNKILIDMEFDYLKMISFTAEKIDSLWFIVDYNEHKSIVFNGKDIKTAILKCNF